MVHQKLGEIFKESFKRTTIWVVFLFLSFLPSFFLKNKSQWIIVENTVRLLCNSDFKVRCFTNEVLYKNSLENYTGQYSSLDKALSKWKKWHVASVFNTVSLSLVLWSQVLILLACLLWCNVLKSPSVFRCSVMISSINMHVRWVRQTWKPHATQEGTGLWVASYSFFPSNNLDSINLACMFWKYDHFKI